MTSDSQGSTHLAISPLEAKTSDGITHDPQTWPRGDKIWHFCQCIARAEGADVQHSVPDSFNNPGDLSRGDEHGFEVAGYQVLRDGEPAIIYKTKADGWNALRRKVVGILEGRSRVYSPENTVLEMAKHYAGNSAVWAHNVALGMGVTMDAKLKDILP